MYCSVHVVFHYAFHAGHGLVLNGKQGAEHSRRYSAGDLQGAARFGAVTDHARKVGNHILDTVGYLLVVSAHKIGNATAAAGRGDYAAAKCAQAAETLFDIYGGEVAQDQGPGELFPGIVILLGKDDHRHSRSDSLVAAARIAHHGDVCTCHSRIAGSACGAEYMAESAVSEYALPEGPAEGLAEFVSVIALQ